MLILTFESLFKSRQMNLEVQTRRKFHAFNAFNGSMRSRGSKVEEMKSKILPQGRKVNFDSQDI